MFQAGPIMNQRPIRSHPSTPEDRIYLCPNDLILGRSSTHAPQGPFKERVINKRRFDHIQSIMQIPRKKWSRDLFLDLAIQPKWHAENRNIQKDNVALVQDNNVVRDEWKLGIVSETFPGKDDLVKRVNVSYNNFPTQEKIHR